MTLRPYSQALQQAYRETLSTPGAPEVIDDSSPVVPVAVVAQVNTASTSTYTRVTDGTDTLSINTSGNFDSQIALPQGTQSIVNATGTGTGSSQNAYTVTTGKTFYLYGVGTSGGGYNINVYANDGTTLRCAYRGNGTNNTWSPICSAVPIAVYTSAQVVKVTCDTSGTWFLWGVEQ